MADWNEVTVLRKKQPKGNTKTPQAINSAQRHGVPIDTQKKWAAGQNKQHSVDKNTMKLDQETEELHHDKISIDVGRLIQQGRQAKGLSQKDLANKINEKPQVVTEYEQGKAIPNQAVLSKMERILEIKLRGKEKGMPMIKKH